MATPRKTRAEQMAGEPNRRILVKGTPSFVIEVPAYSKLTYGPYSPPNTRGGGFNPVGTLRVYGKTKEDMLGVFTGVDGFHDLSLGYTEVDPVVLGVSAAPAPAVKGRRGPVFSPLVATSDADGPF